MARITTKTGSAEAGQKPGGGGCPENGLRKGSKPAGLQISEKAWLEQVIDLAEDLGWETYHPWLSVRSEPGWPDLALWRERLVLAELKTDKLDSHLTEAQDRVIGGLRAAGVEVYVWRPADLATAKEILERREPTPRPDSPRGISSLSWPEAVRLLPLPKQGSLFSLSYEIGEKPGQEWWRLRLHTLPRMRLETRGWVVDSATDDMTLDGVTVEDVQAKAAHVIESWSRDLQTRRSECVIARVE